MESDDPTVQTGQRGPPETARPADALGPGTDRLTPLHPDYVWVLRFRAAASALVPVGAVLFLAPSLPPDSRVAPELVIALVVALALASILLLPRRRWRAWGYREEEDELHVGHGLLVRYRTVVPFGRVQHIDVAQGPIERRYGLATLILHTAGTRAASVPLPGLPHDEAERMRDRIRAKIRQELE